MQICWQKHVPGIVIHSSVDIARKEIALVYRVLREDGGHHRVRIYQIDGCKNISIEEIKRRSIENFNHERSIFINSQMVPEDSINDSSEDFAVKGSFSITAFTFSNNTITYSRIPDHYQYRVLK
jgi:hypothetical protein